MKFFTAGFLLLVSCTTSKTFLSPIHEDLDKVCRFSPATEAFRHDLSQLGPSIRPHIKTKEMTKILSHLDSEGGNELILLADAFGYSHCDLIDTLKSDQSQKSASR